MKIANPFSAKHWSFGKIVFILWVLFSSVIAIYSSWNFVVVKTYDKGLVAGQQNIIDLILSRLQSNKCTPLEVSGYKLIELSCFKQNIPTESVQSSENTLAQDSTDTNSDSLVEDEANKKIEIKSAE